jgi:pyruvate/2-oxoglutarate dehydrogenase complex dihydrolipoamide acyltransferase (E2) component
MTAIRSPLQGTVVSIEVLEGAHVQAGQVVFLVESMKMHHEVAAPEAGRIDEFLVGVGIAVMPGDVLAHLSAVAAPDGHGAAPDDAGRGDERRPSAPTSPRSSTGTGSGSTTPGPARSPNGGRSDAARRGRTSPIWSTRGRSSSTARSSSPPSAGAATSTT